MSMNMPRRTARSTTTVRATQRVVTLLVALMALAGTGLSVRLATSEASSAAPHRVGVPVDTSFGTVTVTRTNVAFVPATQGPPTMAAMNGTQGADQLQVWVRLVNDGAPHGLRYSFRQFSLIDAAGNRHEPDGSSLGHATLPAGGSVDGQVWFSLAGGAQSVPRSLEYSGDGRTVRFALPRDAADVADGTGHEH
jgi:hypothetical protein